MDYAFSEQQLAIRDSVQKLCARFDDAYWLKKDKEGGFPHDFYAAMAEAGWLGIAMPHGRAAQGSPTLSSSTSPVSRRALNFLLSPLRLPFRHARTARLYP